MATIVPALPQWVGTPGILSPNLRWFPPNQNKSWAEGDLVIASTTGTINTPNPNGSLATLAGPTDALIAAGKGQSSSANVPALSYFAVVTYTGGGGIESLPSNPFVINTTFGNVPTLTIPSTGAPAAATGFRVYIGVIPGSYSSQGAATALGGTFTGAFPLTNTTGYARAANSVSTGIVGLAQAGTFSRFAAGPGGSSLTAAGQLFGASQSMPPGWDADNYKSPVLDLAPNRGYLVINLLQPWYSTLEGAAVGFTIDTTNPFSAPGGATNLWYADTGATQAGNIVDRLDLGGLGDVGALVRVQLLSTAVA